MNINSDICKTSSIRLLRKQQKVDFFRYGPSMLRFVPTVPGFIPGQLFWLSMNKFNSVDYICNDTCFKKKFFTDFFCQTFYLKNSSPKVIFSKNFSSKIFFHDILVKIFFLKIFTTKHILIQNFSLKIFSPKDIFSQNFCCKIFSPKTFPSKFFL